MKQIFEIYRETMLTPKQVLDKAVDKTLPGKNTTAWTKKYFSKVVDQIGDEAFGIFLVEQERAGKRAMKKYFDDLIPKFSSREEIIEIVSGNQLGEMLRNRIYLVVSSELKEKVPHYRKAVNVLSFEEFFQNHLDPALKRWEKARVIK